MSPLQAAPSASGDQALPARRSGRRLVGHVVAWMIAAVVAALIFASYRQPDLILDLAGLRLCGLDVLRWAAG